MWEICSHCCTCCITKKAINKIWDVIYHITVNWQWKTKKRRNTHEDRITAHINKVYTVASVHTSFIMWAIKEAIQLIKCNNLLLTSIFSFCLVPHTVGSWVCWHTNGNHLLWGQHSFKPSISSAEPIKTGHHDRRQPCHGNTHQLTSSIVSHVWLHLRAPSAVPKVPEEHFHLHTTGDAEPGSRRPTSKAPKAEKWPCCVRNICADATIPLSPCRDCCHFVDHCYCTRCVYTFLTFFQRGHIWECFWIFFFLHNVWSSQDGC